MNPIDDFQQALAAEAEALQAARQRNWDMVGPLVQHVLRQPGKIIVSGVGKSGLIGGKIAATLNSTGTAAVFMHAGEAFHGDLGVCHPGDTALLISKSGTTVELVRLIPLLRSFGISIIALCGNPQSPIARQADWCLDASVIKEADPHNLAPTSSTTLALALADALAIALMKARNFDEDAFARYHPGGQLGKNLLVKVGHILHGPEKVALTDPGTPLKQVIIRMTEKPLGAACVVNEKMELLGLITEGDIRRALVQWDDIRNVTAGQIMSATPQIISPEETVMQAIELMEGGSRALSVLPVVSDGKFCGLVRIHDVY